MAKTKGGGGFSGKIAGQARKAGLKRRPRSVGLGERIGGGISRSLGRTTPARRTAWTRRSGRRGRGCIGCALPALAVVVAVVALPMLG